MNTPFTFRWPIGRGSYLAGDGGWGPEETNGKGKAKANGEGKKAKKAKGKAKKAKKKG